MASSSSSSSRRGARRQHQHLVRPRWVWGGLLVALAGAVVCGVGISVSSWIVSVLGAVVLVVGGVAAWRGGALFDAHGAFQLDQELHDVKEGNVREGTKAGEEVRSPAAHRESRRADLTRERSTAGTALAPRPGLSVLGAILLLTGSAFVLATQGMYPHTLIGQNNAARDLGLAVVAGLVGLLGLVSPRRHPLGAALALLAAVGMVLQAWLAPHVTSRTVGFEIAVAITLALGAIALLDVRRPRAGLPAHGIDRTSGVVAR